MNSFAIPCEVPVQTLIVEIAFPSTTQAPSRQLFIIEWLSQVSWGIRKVQGFVRTL